MTHILSLGPLLRMARDTVIDPQEGATLILSLRLPRQALWLAFALVVVLSLILGQLAGLLTEPSSSAEQMEEMTGLNATPLTLGLLQAGFLYIMIHAITSIGRLFGGTGRFEETMSLMLWLQFIFICIQVVQLVALVVLPPMAALIMLAALGLFFWLLVNFIAVLHGFTSLGMVFVMTIVSATAVFFALSIVMMALGISATGQL